MCWKCAYNNPGKLCCAVVLTGNETSDSQVLLHITFSCRCETITDTWEEFPPPIIPTLAPDLQQSTQCLRLISPLTSNTLHTVMVNLDIVFSAHCSSLCYDVYWRCLPVILGFFATYILLCLCSTAVFFTMAESFVLCIRECTTVYSMWLTNQSSVSVLPHISVHFGQNSRIQKKLLNSEEMNSLPGTLSDARHGADEELISVLHYLTVLINLQLQQLFYAKIIWRPLHLHSVRYRLELYDETSDKLMTNTTCCHMLRINLATDPTFTILFVKGAMYNFEHKRHHLMHSSRLA